MSAATNRPPPNSPPGAPKNKSPTTKLTRGGGNTGDVEMLALIDYDHLTSGPTQKTPAKKKKRVGWAGKTKGYSYKVSKQGSSKGTGPAKASTAAPRRKYKHTEVPTIDAGDLATTRSTRSTKGDQRFHALPYPEK